MRMEKKLNINKMYAFTNVLALRLETNPKAKRKSIERI